jgi:acyl transferase domain-containing protein/acyl carrier protein
MTANDAKHLARDIAVVGMVGRFPGARTLEEFWQNLRKGVESIRFFTDEELLEAGTPRAMLERDDYVRAGTVLDDADLFDASFFGFSPREAEIMDPQQRIFLECAWEVLESGGYDPERCRERIGVYAGAGHNNYMLNVLSNRDVMAKASHYQALLGNDRSFFTTRICYKLNLTGPSFTVQAACSTSLVAVHLACQHLLDYECDLALAGGATVTFPQVSGYVHQAGMILSPDGHCRAFDERAAGTVAGKGVGIVLLKRLSEALEDGDTIHAVIKASAVNNDGAAKVGFTAPSVEGQAEVIAEALAKAELGPESLSCIEAHGTGTELGDPIEIAALTRAFRTATSRKQFCAIGSLKTNLGHMDAAAGIGGLLKAILSVKNGEIPPSLHFEKPNPKLDLEESPFYVNTELRAWPEETGPRRCGVSAFGIGGTNAHVIVEEPPRSASSKSPRREELLVLSAKTEAALDRASENLASYLSRNETASLADVAYTLSVGRRSFPHRRAFVAGTPAAAARILSERDPSQLRDSRVDSAAGGVAFLFPGQGAQHAGMGRELYRVEPAYRKELDHCCEILLPHLGLDLREPLLAEPGDPEAGEILRETRVTQPALFAVEYSLARLLIGWGIEPKAMVGHSIGEYVAACLASVFSLEDALALVAARGRRMQSAARGSMTAVGLGERELLERVPAGIGVAAVNAPALTVVSGAERDIEAFERALSSEGVECRRLRTSHAFHSAMMDPILDGFREDLGRVALKRPARRFVSNVTGDFIRDEEATDPGYWVRHLREPVRFADGVAAVLREDASVLLEVGPGNALGSLAKQQLGRAKDRVFLAAMPGASARASESEVLRSTLGRLWLAGAPVSFSDVYANERRVRVPLPTYPFERQRFWVAAQAAPVADDNAVPAARGRKRDLSDWFYVPGWKETPRAEALREIPREPAEWLFFTGPGARGAALAEEVRSRGETVSIAGEGDSNPGSVLEDLSRSGSMPRRIVFVGGGESERKHFFDLARALARLAPERPLDVALVSAGLHEVVGGEPIREEAAMLPGVGLVLSQEQPSFSFASYDVQGEVRARDLVSDIASLMSGEVVAYRGGKRWVQSHEPLRLGPNPPGKSRLRERGVYLVTGGLGNVGLEAAGFLAETCRARLVLVSRTALPARATWPRVLDERGSDDPLSRRIQRVLALEALGAEVALESADVSDELAMKAVMERARERFGALHGVIHAAADVDPRGMRPLAALTPEDCERQFRPKVAGTRVLETLLAGAKLDFVLLTSSLSTVLGGLGYGAYAAANCFLKAASSRIRRESETPWIAVDWDGWDFRLENKVGAAEYAMSPEEGRETLRRVLATDLLDRVVISTGGLEVRIASWVKKRAAAPAEEKAAPRHPHPSPGGNYVAPRDRTEEEIATIWQDLLGIERIGIHDNFFELGGHSLLATQVIARLRSAFRVELPLRSMFEASTVKELSERIKAVMWAKDQESAAKDDAALRQEIEL